MCRIFLKVHTCATRNYCGRGGAVCSVCVWERANILICSCRWDVLGPKHHFDPSLNQSERRQQIYARFSIQKHVFLVSQLKPVVL